MKINELTINNTSPQLSNYFKKKEGLIMNYQRLSHSHKLFIQN